MKKKLCIVVLAACVSMTGCAASVPELTDTDSEMISQYLAGAVLNHDADYKYGFSYDKSVLKPTPTPEPTPTLVPVQTKNPESKDDRPVNDGTDSVPEVKEVDLASLYGNGIEVKYKSYEVTKNITTEYSSVSAHDGKKLIVLRFKVKNSSNSTRKINLFKKNVTYSISINGKDCGAPLFSIAEGDMQYFTETVPAGKSKEGLLIFEIDKSAKLKNVVLNADNGKKKSSVNIK